jgi:hypothetical protein
MSGEREWLAGQPTTQAALRLSLMLNAAHANEEHTKILN